MNISDDIYLRMIEEVEDYAILLLDKNGNIETWNKGAEKIKGYKRDEVIGKNFRIFYTEEDRKNSLPEKLITEASANGKAIYEGWRVRKDGTMFWGNIVVTAIHNEGGSLAGFTKVTRDLTEKKQAEEKLLQFNEDLERKVKEQTEKIQKSEKRFRSLIENSFDALSLFDEKGNILYLSPGAGKLTGYTLEEMQGKDRMDFFHPDDRAEAAQIIETAIKNPGKPLYGISRFWHKQGHYTWIEGTVTSLLEDESVRAIVRNFKDITERKLAEEKIIQANRLYAFISAINQTIVHVSDEQTLYDETCRIAVDIGKFDLAWIGIMDPASKTLKLGAQCNASASDLEVLKNITYDNDLVFGLPLLNGKYYVVNDLQKETDYTRKEYTKETGLRSRISLPIKKAGKTIGICNLLSKQSNFFDEQEIMLLEEVAGDISFALENFAREQHRKQMLEETLNSELRLKQAEEIAHFGNWSSNIATGVSIWSEETCKIHGVAPGETLQSYQDWLSFLHPEDVSMVLSEMDKCRQKLENTAFHYRIVRRDESVRYLYSYVQVEVNKDGKLTGFYGVVHDETDIKKGEDALAQSEANLRLIMDLIPQGIFAKDINGKYLFVNKSFAALYGHTTDQLLDRTIQETIPSKSQIEYLLNQDQEVILSGETIIIPEQSFTDHNGYKRIFHTIKLPYTMASTNEQAVLGITNEITEQKKAEVEGTKMMADIVQRNVDLEQFSYIVSHNLRAPVANILGLIDVVQTIGTDKAELEEEKVLSHLGTAAKNLDTVIRDLNQILEVKQQLNEKKQNIPFESLLNEIKISIENVIKEEHVLIISDFSKAVEYSTIKSYLYSIFLNLISNSIKYHQPGIASIIEITSTRIKNNLLLTFKDNGLGIDLTKRSNDVFRLYKRFHFHVTGKGMGLYMVKAQVEALGGTISIASEPNKGTQFTIVFEEETHTLSPGEDEVAHGS